MVAWIPVARRHLPGWDSLTRGRRGGEARRAEPERRSRPMFLPGWPLDREEIG